MRIRRGVAVAVATALMGLQMVPGASGSGAAEYDDGSFRPPANDAFASAARLDPGKTVTGTTRDATGEADDPGLSCDDYGSGAPSVWYRVTAPHAGVLSVARSSYGAVALFRGASLDSLVEAACDWGGGTARAVVAAGEVIMVAVPHDRSWYSDDPSFELSAAMRGLAPPSNDAFADAVPLVSGEIDATTLDSSVEPGEPLGSCATDGDGTVWYSVTPQQATRLAVSSSSDLTLFEGSSLAEAVEVGCGHGSLVRTLDAGSTYRLAVSTDPFRTQATPLSVELATSAPNDDPAGAIVLAGTGPVTGTTSFAGYSDGEPRPRCADGTDASVWYRFTASADGTAVVEVEPESWSPSFVVAVYQPTLGPAITCQEYSGRAVAAVDAGQEYLVQVASRPWEWATTNRFTIRVGSEAATPGDRFADARVADFPTAPGQPVALPSGTSSREADEPETCLGESGTTWVRFHAPTDLDGRGTADAQWAAAAVFEGDPRASLASLRLLACGYRPSFAVSPGQSYWVAVADWFGSSELSLTHDPSPANDDVADAPVATLVPTVPVSTSGTATTATSEAGEPVCGHDASVWYRYTPTVDGRASFVVDSDVNHAVGVYLGDDPGRLTPLRCGNLPVHEVETVTVPVAAGRTYAVRVARTDTSTEGSFRLTTVLSPADRPANDDFGPGASALTAGVPVRGTVDAATVEHGEPDHDCPLIEATATVDTARLQGQIDDPAVVEINGGRAPGSVWYRLDVVTAGLVRVRLASDDELGFTVYRGAALDALEPVLCRDRRLPRRDEVGDVNLSPGTYWVAVDDRSTARGEPSTDQDFRLSVERLVTPPANDGFAAATAIPLSGSASGDTALATLEPGEPNHQCPLLPRREYTHSVWYDLGTPSSDGRLVAGLQGEADQTLALYEGGALPGLARVTCVDVPLLDEEANEVSLRSGSRYFLAVLSDEERTARFELDLSFVPAEGPANDDVGDAAALTFGTSNAASTVGATVEPGEPSTCGAGVSVWYRFTAPADGQLRLEMDASVLHTFSLYTPAHDGLAAVFCSTDAEEGGRLGLHINDDEVTVEGDLASSGDVHVIPVEGQREYLLAVKGFEVADARTEGAVAFTPGFFRFAPNDLAGPTAEPIDAAPGAPPARGDLRSGTGGDEVQRGNSCWGSGASLWYRYRPASDGVLELRLDTGPHLWQDGIHADIYSGPHPGVLRHERCAFEYDGLESQGGRTTLPVVGGRTYWVRVAAQDVEAEGPFALGATFAAAPSDDDLGAVSAAVLDSSNPTRAWTGSLAGATLEYFEDAPCGYSSSTVWRAFRVASPGVVEATLTAPEGMQLSLWRADTATPRFGALRQVTCREIAVAVGDVGFNTFAVAGNASSATVTVDAESQYFVSVGGYQDVRGLDYAASLTWAPAPLAPEVSIGDVTVAEPAGAAEGFAELEVSVSRPSLYSMSIPYDIEGRTATAGVDFDGASGHVYVAPGATSATVTIPLRADGVDEDDESFAVHLRPEDGTVLRDGTGVATITDSDPTPQLRVDDVRAGEADGAASFEIVLDRPSSRTVRFSWRTADGTATARQDYTGGSGLLTIPAGETVARLRVPIMDDRRAEVDETFTVTLSEASHATIADGRATATIVDNDGRRSR